MQVTTKTIIKTPPTANNNILDPTPALNVWQSLYYELSDAGYSKQQIAQWSAISVRTVDRLLHGETQQPTYRSFYSLLHAYCCYAVNQPAMSGHERRHA